MERNKPVRLHRSFFQADGLSLAQACLGKLFCFSNADGILLGGLITETEAYMGATDRASHAYGGRKTARNAVLYERGGVCYVYRIYGIYDCLNFTAGDAGAAEAVLIRAIVPVWGAETMAARCMLYGKAKSYPDPAALTARERLAMTNGPGKLCLALGIDRTQNGYDLCDGTRLALWDIGFSCPSIMECLPRVGIDYAGEDREKPWRFRVDGAACLTAWERRPLPAEAILSQT